MGARIEREVDSAEAAEAPRAATGGAGQAVASMLALQRTAGNRATIRQLQRLRSHPAGARASLLQRQVVAPASADPSSLAADVHRLLHEPDPVAGMRVTDAIQRLDGLDTSQLIGALRALRAIDATDLPTVKESAPLLISCVAQAVRLEAVSAPEPEQLAALRGRVQRLPAADQAALIAAYPSSAVPGDPPLPAGGLVPPPGTPPIPGPLLETLYHSYARRQAGLPGSEQYLDNAFWGGRPADLWQAISRLGPALGVITRVYARWTATSVPWSFVDAILNTWTGSSEGFNFVCRDRAGLEAALNASSSFCEDHVGGAYHWWKEGSTPCWREMISGSPGLHFCTGNGTSVHIDPHQVVSGSWPGGYCSYDITGSVFDHFHDLGWW